jgi:hypothetical protein
VKLSAYKKVILLSNEENADEMALYHFCNIHPKMQEGMRKKDLDMITDKIGKVLNEKPSLVNRFKYKDKEYGFHPKIEDISMGEFIDLEEYLKEPYQNAEKILGILYRPITKKLFGRYSIESYDPDVHDGSGFQDLSADIFLGCLLFFYRIEIKLYRTFLQSLGKDQKDMIFNPNSQGNGDGMERYTRLLKEISSSLTE